MVNVEHPVGLRFRAGDGYLLCSELLKQKEGKKEMESVMYDNSIGNTLPVYRKSLFA